MKKLLFVLPLAVMLLAATIAIAGAGMGYEDPALCVNGKWLLVNAAHPDAIEVTVPKDVKYGDQQAGGCEKPISYPLITNVRVGRVPHLMTVTIDEKQATPKVEVSYGMFKFVRQNNGKHDLFFAFPVK